MEHVYTVPGSSISLEELDSLQKNGEIELFALVKITKPIPMAIPDDPVTDQWH